MEIDEIIRRLERIAPYGTHYPGEPLFVLSLDDGVALKEAIELLKKQKPQKPGMTDITAPEVLMALKVLRDYCKSLTKCTNPNEYKHNRSFVDMMDDPEITGFGDWMFANGFNIALTAIECRIDEYIKTVVEIIDMPEEVSGDA